MAIVAEHQDSDSRHQTLRNWVIFCALIAALEIVGVFAAHRFGDGDGADDEEFNVPTILFVADDGDERLPYAAALQRDGYVIIGVADAGSALARIQRDRPAAVVLDVKSSDRLQMLTRIHELTPTLPVIVNAICPGCENEVMNRTAGTYYADSPSSEDVKRAVLSALDHSCPVSSITHCVPAPVAPSAATTGRADRRRVRSDA